MSNFSNVEARAIFGFSIITGAAFGLISTHWFGAAAAVGVGLVSFVISFFTFANMAR